MSSLSDPLLFPPGPTVRFDVNVDEESFQNLAEWKQQYGSLFKVETATRNAPAYILTNPEHVKHVLITNHKNYAKGVGFERVKMLLGNGIIVSDGDFWRSQRRMIQPGFHRQIIADMSKMMQRCNALKLIDWQQKAQVQTPINITLEMSELALEVILRALFSDDLDKLIAETGNNPFAMVVNDVTRDLKFAMQFRALTKHVSGIMQARRDEKRFDADFLSMLMTTRNKDTDEPMSDKAIIDEVMTIIVAGHETTAGTLNWAWYLLSQNAEVESKLHAEIDTLANSTGRSPDFTDLEQLKFTRQVAEETLRLYPPVWLFTRKAIGADTLDNYYVPAGTDIFLCPYLLHHDEAHWERPEKFMPERFDSDIVKERNKHAYFPFSLGSRRCIGEFFSMVDMQLHLALLARHIRLTHLPDKPIELQPHINLRTRHDIMMMPHLRNTAPL